MVVNARPRRRVGKTTRVSREHSACDGVFPPEPDAPDAAESIKRLRTQRAQKKEAATFTEPDRRQSGDGGKASFDKCAAGRRPPSSAPRRCPAFTPDGRLHLAGMLNLVILYLAWTAQVNNARASRLAGALPANVFAI